MDDFTKQYLIAALWSSNDDEGTPLDRTYDIDDLAPEAIEQAKADCADFQQSMQANLDRARELLDATRNNEKFDAVAALSHDFWLTRCGHGAGFWDRGLGITGDRLTSAAKVYGEIDLHVGDDGKLYFS